MAGYRRGTRGGGEHGAAGNTGTQCAGTWGTLGHRLFFGAKWNAPEHGDTDRVFVRNGMICPFGGCRYGKQTL